jgi:VIT1/CCC1 family predicted Fe2+/Mn2+ transporter
VAAAYALGAAFPVIPYALPIAVETAFALSAGCTLAALFVAGALKTMMTGRPWLRSGTETVAVGALAAAATFLAGRLIAPNG